MRDFQAANNGLTLMLGDAMDRMAEIESGSVDMICADPPYTMTKNGKSVRPNYMPVSMGDNMFSGKLPVTADWMAECYRVLRNDGAHFYTFCNINDVQISLNAATAAGFKLHNIISMIKDTKMPNRWYLKYTELVLFFRKGPAKPINDMTSRDYVQVTMPTQANGKVHITQKPLDFIQKIVTNSSSPGDLVLDPFMGSATTGIACLNTGRRFIGIERDEACFSVACDRVLNHIAETPELRPAKPSEPLSVGIHDLPLFAMEAAE